MNHTLKRSENSDEIVSVIIPVINGEESISTFLDSLFKQTYSYIEV